jgi:hypothetical protein
LNTQTLNFSSYQAAGLRRSSFVPESFRKKLVNSGRCPEAPTGFVEEHLGAGRARRGEPELLCGKTASRALDGSRAVGSSPQPHVAYAPKTLTHLSCAQPALFDRVEKAMRREPGERALVIKHLRESPTPLAAHVGVFGEEEGRFHSRALSLERVNGARLRAGRLVAIGGNSGLPIRQLGDPPSYAWAQGLFLRDVVLKESLTAPFQHLLGEF